MRVSERQKREREREKNVSQLNKRGILFLYPDGDRVTLGHFRSNHLCAARHPAPRRDATLRVYAGWLRTSTNHVLRYAKPVTDQNKIAHSVDLSSIPTLHTYFLVYLQ